MKHLAVWIDNMEARIFAVDADQVGRTVVHAPGPHIHRHLHEQEMKTRNHPDDEHRYFHEVASALEGTGKVLLVGPSHAKLHFLRYLQSKAPSIEARIVGVETVDHPTDAQLVAHLKHYFHEDAERRE